MIFEKFPEPQNSDLGNDEKNNTVNPTERDIKRLALELELENVKVEEMQKGQERDEAIERVSALNESLAELEALTGLSEEEILAEYETLTKESAEKGIQSLIEELELSDKEKTELISGAQNGNPKLLELLKKVNPKKLAFAAACFLIIGISTTTSYAESAQTTGEQQTSYHVSLDEQRETKSTFLEHGQDGQANEAVSTKKAAEIIKKADQRAKVIIESVEGFIKPLAQKKVVDTIADNKEVILASIDDTYRENPNLGNASAQKLFEVYKDLIQEVDELNDEEASKKVRGTLKEKIELISTKDYDRIKRELLG